MGIAAVTEIFPILMPGSESYPIPVKMEVKPQLHVFGHIHGG
jgi:hypothetical protein